ncbi:YebC/PmpR family DNA-binding transcriptional regulator [Patescibacteria group bacterium]
MKISMSGHSKWSTIKRKKAVTDAKRGAVFTKLARAITVAARQGGGDPALNVSLRLEIEKARQANMPKDNIDRAVKRGTGELEGAILEEKTYEGYGPEGVAIVIKTVTDNSNRTVADIRKIFTQHGGSLGESGSVLWMFEARGILRMPIPDAKSRDDIELVAIDKGAEDIKEEDDQLVISANPKNLTAIKEALDDIPDKEIAMSETSVELIAKNEITISDESVLDKLEKLFEALDDLDDVQEVFSNHRPE